jgi:exosome complex component RRP4
MSILIPGQLITSEIGYLRGHGSYSDELDSGIGLFSAVAGKIERINKLITVKPIRSRLLNIIFSCFTLFTSKFVFK